jgi:RES domain-containing protein
MTFSAMTAAARLRTLGKPAPSRVELFFRNMSFLRLAGTVSDVLNGKYSGVSGGRYNPPKSGPVCYLAGTQTGAAFEIEQEQLLLGFGNTPNPTPRITFGVSVEGAVLLDLTNQMLWPNLSIVGDQSDVFMPSSDWKELNQQGMDAPMQQLGAAARAAGYDGILYPAIVSQYIGTSLPRLHNLALFMSPTAPATPANTSVVMQLHHHGALTP